MKIPVVGMDPSLLHWGLAESFLDLSTGVLDTPILRVIEPDREKSKQVRKNSKDLSEATQLATIAMEAARKAKVVFIECPVGSQNARSMASYGVCVGILGSIIAEGIPLIEVTALDVKLALSGNKNATKKEMIATAVDLYPEGNWPRQDRSGAKFKKGDLMASAEHAADAIGAIYAGVNTPLFTSLMRLLQHKES